MSGTLDFFRDPQNSALVNILMFLLGGISGFFVSRFTLTKAEKLENRRNMADRASSHSRELDKKYIDFCSAMRDYTNLEGKPSLDHFYRISTAGDLYFGEMRTLCDAILLGQIDVDAAKRTFAPRIIEAIQKNIYLYYETLQSISERMGGTYSGKFERENYESLFEVAEKYGPVGGYNPFCQ